jgi:hypothetical protein
VKDPVLGWSKSYQHILLRHYQEFLLQANSACMPYISLPCNCILAFSFRSWSYCLPYLFFSFTKRSMSSFGANSINPGYHLQLHWYLAATIKGKAIPLQALTGPEVISRFRLPDFKKTGTWRWQGCQPYAPAFIPRKHSWYSFLLEAE